MEAEGGVPPAGSSRLQFPSSAREQALDAAGAQQDANVAVGNSTFDYDRALLLTKLAAVTQCQVTQARVFI
jgi:hypothetical protein